MRRSLTIAVAQLRAYRYDLARNAEVLAKTIRGADARVVVFPEPSLTGYHLDAPRTSHEDLCLQQIIDACAHTGSIALVGATAAARTTCLRSTGSESYTSVTAPLQGDWRALRSRTL